MSILDGIGLLTSTTPDPNWSLVFLDDVREALMNPTDEQVERIVEWIWEQNPLDQEFGRSTVRAVLAAAAGGDQ